ncbi:MAG: protein TolR [Gammaproteobacteria bacterium]|nr:protein TolR [Gammaproteobacteria bacterium]
MRQRKKLNSEMNVVPYVDVMLVLLVIFMTTAPLLLQGVDIDLPNAKAKAINQEAETPIVVSIDKTGAYYLNITETPKSAMDSEALSARVAAELTKSPKRAVLVKGDKAVDYGKVVTAMALLQSAGAPSVGLMTDSTGLD